MKTNFNPTKYFLNNKLFNYFYIFFIYFSMPLGLAAEELKQSLQPTSMIQPSQQIKGQFNPVDGSHIKFRQYIKNNIINGDSFIHAGTAYAIKDEHINISMAYRAKNKFGMALKYSANADYSFNGQLLNIYKIK